MRDYETIKGLLRGIAAGFRAKGNVHASKTCDEAADAIEELLDELTTIRKQFPRWISVEERLPHYLDYVLCVNKFGIQMVGYLTDYKEGGFRCESGMDSCDYITHWMPLPTPPKGVE